MRIGVNVSGWSSGGDRARFTRGLVEAMLTSAGDDEIVLFADRRTIAGGGLPDGVTVRVLGSSDRTTPENVSFIRSLASVVPGRSTAGEDFDVIFHPSVETWTPLRSSGRVVLGIDDTAPEDYPALAFPDRYRRALWNLRANRARARADYIVTPSEFSGERIRHHFHYSGDRVLLVNPAPDPLFRQLQRNEREEGFLRSFGVGEGRRFLLYLGGVGPLCNLGAMLQAVSSLRTSPRLADVKLLMVFGPTEGETARPAPAEVALRIRELELRDVVHVSGHLNEGDLCQLMNAATALVLPSFVEGLGMRALEAAACATPVVATVNSPLPALLGDGGLFFDPAGTAELTRALTEVLSNEERRVQMGRHGRKKASDLSPQRAAGEMLGHLSRIGRSV